MRRIWFLSSRGASSLCSVLPRTATIPRQIRTITQAIHLLCFIHKRWMAWVIVLICLGIVAVLGRTLQSELAPLEDKNQMRLMMTGPEGASFQYMIKATEEVQNYLIDSIP